MLYRRKVLLALLQALGDGLQKIDFQKHLFLFTRSQKAASFDFIPYKFGCFSFIAEADRQVLIKQGQLRDAEVWARSRNQDYAGSLNADDRAALIAHRKRFGDLRGRDLVHYVYKLYPYYAINSTIADDILSGEDLDGVKRANPARQGPALLTIGYESKSIDAYLNQLIEQDIDVLCDVRKNPLSRKYGFSKKSLKQATERVSVEYRHYPDLGIPSAQRRSLDTQQDYDQLFDHYEREILPEGGEDIDQIISLLEEGRRVALTCFELHPQQCHRSRVANAITERLQWLHSPLNI